MFAPFLSFVEIFPAPVSVITHSWLMLWDLSHSIWAKCSCWRGYFDTFFARLIPARWKSSIKRGVIWACQSCSEFKEMCEVCDAFEGTQLYMSSPSYSENTSCTPEWPCSSNYDVVLFFFCPFHTFSAGTDLLISLLSPGLFTLSCLFPGWLAKVHAVDLSLSDLTYSHSLRSRLKVHQLQLSWGLSQEVKHTYILWRSRIGPHTCATWTAEYRYVSTISITQ